MSQFDVTAILDADFNQLFEDARAIKCSVSRASKVMEHPLETGETIVDHTVILPVSIELSMVLSAEGYASVYQDILSMYKQAETMIVQTRVDSFNNMIIEAMPHEESADIIDGVTVALKLKECKFSTTKYTESKPIAPAPSKSKSVATKKRGQQQPEEATDAKKKSTLLSILGG
jgi:hypothetical protein